MNEPRSASDRSAALAAQWRMLRDHVEARFRQASDEVRGYPTPIARCDEQLPALIEQRDRARLERERALAVDAASRDEAAFTRALEQFLAIAGAADDEPGLALRRRLRADLQLP